MKLLILDDFIDIGVFRYKINLWGIFLAVVCTPVARLKLHVAPDADSSEGLL